MPQPLSHCKTERRLAGFVLSDFRVVEKENERYPQSKADCFLQSHFSSGESIRRSVPRPLRRDQYRFRHDNCHWPCYRKYVRSLARHIFQKYSEWCAYRDLSSRMNFSCLCFAAFADKKVIQLFQCRKNIGAQARFGIIEFFAAIIMRQFIANVQSINQLLCKINKTALLS